MSNLDTSAPSSYRLVLKGTLILSSFAILYGILDSLTFKKNEIFQKQGSETSFFGLAEKIWIRSHDTCGLTTKGGA